MVIPNRLSTDESNLFSTDKVVERCKAGFAGSYSPDKIDLKVVDFTGLTLEQTKGPIGTNNTELERTIDAYADPRTVAVPFYRGDGNINDGMPLLEVQRAVSTAVPTINIEGNSVVVMSIQVSSLSRGGAKAFQRIFLYQPEVFERVKLTVEHSEDVLAAEMLKRKKSPARP